MIMKEITTLLQHYPQIAIFLSIAAGYYVGKIRFLGFSLGSTAGVLLAALIVGQLDITVHPLFKNVAFALFIFAIGYKVGPQFFGSLKKEGIRYILLSVFFAFVALATALLLTKGFQFDQGTAAGLLGGALTQSAVIGTADGAISHLAVSAAEKQTLQSNVAVAYAITYLFGTAGLILFFKFIPRFLGIDAKKEAKKLEKKMSVEEEPVPELFNWSDLVGLRCYRLTHLDAVGKPVLELERSIGSGAEIKQVKRGDQIFDLKPETVLESGDIVSIIAAPESLVHEKIGEEVTAPELQNQIGELLDVCVLSDQVYGKTLGDLSRVFSRGVFLKQITRQGHKLPVTQSTKIEKCDILRLAGDKEEIEKAIAYIGYPERQIAQTDLVLVGLGCAIGTMIGLLAFKIGGIPITLGAGGGVLVAGLLAGYLRSRHPTFGQIPTAAQWIFTDLGLNLFIACVGLTAGPKAITALLKMGPSIFVAGVILSLVPHILSLLFGKYVLKMNPVLLLGALTGAGTITAALNGLKEETDSNIVALGYTVPYAIGNVLLTVWGTLMVYLT